MTQEQSKNTENDTSAPVQSGNAPTLLSTEPERSDELLGAVGKEPFERAEWNLQMVLAWIIWRTPAAIREFWPHYRPAKSVSDVLDPQMHLDKGILVVSRPDAHEDLWEKLNKKQLSAEGILCGTHDRQVIDRGEWRPEGLGYDLGEGWSPDEIGVWGEPAKYREVRLNREDVLTVWPAREGSVKDPQAENKGPDRKFYFSELKKSDPDRYDNEIEPYASEVLMPEFDKNRPESEQISKDSARRILLSSKIELSDKAFERVWRTARDMAGLPASGGAGRKKLNREVIK